MRASNTHGHIRAGAEGMESASYFAGGAGMKLITNAMLKGACEDQRKLFRKVFPDGAPITVAAARKAQKAGLDVLWLVNILPSPLDDEYRAKCKPLDAEYWAKRKPLDAEYWAKCKPLYDEYRAKCKPLYDEYRAKYIKILVKLLRKAAQA